MHVLWHYNVSSMVPQSYQCDTTALPVCHQYVSTLLPQITAISLSTLGSMARSSLVVVLERERKVLASLFTCSVCRHQCGILLSCFKSCIVFFCIASEIRPLLSTGSRNGACPESPSPDDIEFPACLNNCRLLLRHSLL